MHDGLIRWKLDGSYAVVPFDLLQARTELSRTNKIVHQTIDFGMAHYSIFRCQYKQRTRQIQTPNPEWSESFLIYIDPHELLSNRVAITIWDRLCVDSNDFFGEVVVDLAGRCHVAYLFKLSEMVENKVKSFENRLHIFETCSALVSCMTSLAKDP